ncbi:hypothetical protein [Streptomyces sp. NPDC058629]|uniref:hypothetical protein n=1 Tax=Streptomyces sp. NPDC058629 TaxID=3346565 RepID=UPI00364C8294
MADKAVTVLECVATSTAQYQPGITLTPRNVDVDVSASLSGCTGVAGITAGTVHAQGEGTLSCSTGTYHVSGETTWNDGTVSHFSNAVVYSLRPGGSVVAVVSGTIDSGRFAGATTTTTAVLANTDPAACLSSEGVTSGSGVGAYVLTL